VHLRENIKVVLKYNKKLKDSIIEFKDLEHMITEEERTDDI
jgi:hypothetical protein